jgi:hypothetical protein
LEVNANKTILEKTAGKGERSAVTIPDTFAGVPVIAIGNNAFRRNRTITSVTLPSTITFIGSYAKLGQNL